jgi:LCP family protein required for cell wall assembly
VHPTPGSGGPRSARERRAGPPPSETATRPLPRSGADQRTVPVRQVPPRPGQPGAGRPRRGGGTRVVRVAVAAVSALVLLVTGYAWTTLDALDAGLRRSGVLPGLATSGGAQNILVLGLDSRLDENGNPLPPAVYDALDTGGADVGGYNANVLMLIHLPADGGHASAMSIPRDDYVALAGKPDGTGQGKIKQAYGLAFDQRHKQLVAQHVTDPVALEQRSRDAGRSAEIETVSQFLDVPIDHYIEVTMVAFYQIAQVVAPITVCVNEDTRDSFSGANFHKGYQQIDAAQAVAFVRQRRDTAHPALTFTDLDRERRQQAFIASLAYQLRQAGTLTDPTRLRGLVTVAQQNTAVDPGLDITGLTSTFAGLAGGGLDFTTLPIDHFGRDDRGEDVNIVDTAAVRSAAAKLVDDSGGSSDPTTSRSTAAGTAHATTAPATSAPTSVLASGGIPCVT